jgi:hypothetical protein
MTDIKTKVSLQNYRQNRQRSAPWDHKVNWIFNTACKTRCVTRFLKHVQKIAYSILSAKCDALRDTVRICKTRITYVAPMEPPYGCSRTTRARHWHDAGTSGGSMGKTLFRFHIYYRLRCRVVPWWGKQSVWVEGWCAWWKIYWKFTDASIPQIPETSFCEEDRLFSRESRISASSHESRRHPPLITGYTTGLLRSETWCVKDTLDCSNHWSP